LVAAKAKKEMERTYLKLGRGGEGTMYQLIPGDESWMDELGKNAITATDEVGEGEGEEEEKNIC
jgi:hypothetical protein